MSSSIPDTRLPKLLVIDDNKDITDIIEEIAQDTGFSVLSINDYKLIHNNYRDFNPEVIFLDLDLGLDDDMDMSEKGYDGLAVFRFLADNNCKSKIILISGMSADKRQLSRNIGREMKLNVLGSIPKPFSLEKIEQLLMQLKSDQISEI